MRKQLAVLARFLAHEQIAPCFDIDQALVNVHRTARLIAHRLGQQGGIDAVAHRRFAHGAINKNTWSARVSESARSAQRGVGKESVSTCRYRWTTDHAKTIREYHHSERDQQKKAI